MTDNFEKKVAVDGPVVNAGELGSSTFSPGQALPAGPLGLGQRWTVNGVSVVARQVTGHLVPWRTVDHEDVAVGFLALVMAAGGRHKHIIIALHSDWAPPSRRYHMSFGSRSKTTCSERCCPYRSSSETGRRVRSNRCRMPCRALLARRDLNQAHLAMAVVSGKWLGGQFPGDATAQAPSFAHRLAPRINMRFARRAGEPGLGMLGRVRPSDPDIRDFPGGTPRNSPKVGLIRPTSNAPIGRARRCADPARQSRERWCRRARRALEPVIG